MAGITPIVAGVGLARSLTGSKERRRDEAANRAIDEAEVLTNYLDQLTIPKEPYVIQREMMDQQAAQALAGLQETVPGGVPAAGVGSMAGLSTQATQQMSVGESKALEKLQGIRAQQAKGIRQSGFALPSVAKDSTEFTPSYNTGKSDKAKDSGQTALDNLIDSVYDHMVEREGKRTTVYKDSLGKPTVGVGHLVTEADGLKVGDEVSEEKVREFYEKDIREAARAAQSQASDLGIDDEEFIKALVSVNFQLGTGWNKKFSDTYASIKAGGYEEAIDNIKNSRWHKQTPTRAQDFIEAVAALEKGKTQGGGSSRS